MQHTLTFCPSWIIRDEFTTDKSLKVRTCQILLHLNRRYQKFRLHHLKSPQFGYWQGKKVFTLEYPGNYLQVNPKAPPAILFRPDQVPTYTRESVKSRPKLGGGINKVQSLSEDLYHTLEAVKKQVRSDPRGLSDTNWKKFLKTNQGKIIALSIISPLISPDLSIKPSISKMVIAPKQIQKIIQKNVSIHYQKSKCKINRKIFDPNKNNIGQPFLFGIQII